MSSCIHIPNTSIFSNFLERNPPDEILDTSMLQLIYLIERDLSINSIYVGYNLIPSNMLEDEQIVCGRTTKLGLTSTFGFHKDEFISAKSQNSSIWVCYVAMPINEYGFLAEYSGEMTIPKFETYLQSKVKVNIVSCEDISVKSYKCCRLFKYLFLLEEKPKNYIDLENFSFISSKQIKYENGIDKSDHHKNTDVRIRITRHRTISDAASVTIYNMDDAIPFINANIETQPLVMGIISFENTKIELKGIERGSSLFPSLGLHFSNYGLTIHRNDIEVRKIVLHMLKEKIDIEFFK